MVAVKMSPGTDPATGCGPVITKKAVDKIEIQVADAVARGSGSRSAAPPTEKGFDCPPPS